MVYPPHFHFDGSECRAGHDPNGMLCFGGGGDVYATFAASQMARVRALAESVLTGAEQGDYGSGQVDVAEQVLEITGRSTVG